MIEGVEILNTTYLYGQTWIGLVGLLCLVFGLFATIISLIEGGIKIAIILAIVSAIGGYGLYYDENILTAIEHQAVVEDSVSYKELINKYEIVEVKGKLFTLREKIDDDETVLSSGGEISEI